MVKISRAELRKVPREIIQIQYFYYSRRTNDSIKCIIAYKGKTKILHHLKQRKTYKLLLIDFFLE
jgi:hypothetical protein